MHESITKQDRNNINDPQKKHRLGTVSKNILLEGLNRFNSAPEAYHAVLTAKVFKSVAVSFIAEFSFPFCCFVFYINEMKVKFADHYAITKTDPE